MAVTASKSSPARDEQRKGKEAGGSKRFAVVRLAEQASLLAGLPPDPHVTFAVGPPVKSWSLLKTRSDSQGLDAINQSIGPRCGRSQAT